MKVTVEREVKKVVLELSEEEAIALRDILGSKGVDSYFPPILRAIAHLLTLENL